jgi:hypothetical protein
MIPLLGGVGGYRELRFVIEASNAANNEAPNFISKPQPTAAPAKSLEQILEAEAGPKREVSQEHEELLLLRRVALRAFVLPSYQTKFL